VQSIVHNFKSHFIPLISEWETKWESEWEWDL